MLHTSAAAGLSNGQSDRKKTDEHRTSNECILSVLKKISRSDSILRHSIIDNRYSAVRCFIQAIEAASLIIKKPCHFGLVSYVDYKDDREKPPARRGCSAYASESDIYKYEILMVS